MSTSHQRYHRGQAVHQALNALVEAEHRASTASDARDEQSARINELEARLAELSNTAQIQLGYISALEHDNETMATQNKVLFEEARTDGLTKLPNKRALQEALRSYNSRYERSLQKHADDPTLPVPISYGIVVIDLDGLKEINDTYGHNAGDSVLVEFAHRLQHEVVRRGSDFLARCGEKGDEFQIIVDELDESSERYFREALTKATTLPYDIGAGRSIQVHASVGFAPYVRGKPVEEAVKAADTAMYTHKERSKTARRMAQTKTGGDQTSSPVPTQTSSV